MEISCVYIPEINEQEEDIIMAFCDIAKIEHIEFVVQNRYARVINGRTRSKSCDFDSDKKIVFGLNLSFKRKPKRIAYIYIQQWYNFDFCLKVLKREAYLGKWCILPNENVYQIELYKLKKRVATLENVLSQQTMTSEQFNNDNSMVDSLISILLDNKLETDQTLDDGWIEYKERNCDGTLTFNQNYLAYLKQRLQRVL
jgi:hypothetical protein